VVTIIFFFLFILFICARMNVVTANVKFGLSIAEHPSKNCKY